MSNSTLNKNVLFILNLPPPIHGAAIMGNLIKNSKLIKQNINPQFINLTTSKNLSEIGKNSRLKTWTIIKLYLNVFKTLASKRFGLCYLTINSKGNGFFKDYFIVILLKLFKCKIIYHYHNKGVSEKENEWLQNILYRIQFKNTKVILLSSLLYHDVEKYVRKENVFICPNGIPTISEINLNTLQKIRFQKEIPTILFLSNMMKEKGVYTLLQASRHLANNGFKFKVQFIGEWKDIHPEDFHEFISENGLQEYIYYEGAKYNNEKNKYFENADIFVLPTFNEAFPLVNLEAMQFGLPIIASKVGGIPDIILDNETGFIIEKNNYKILSDKIQFLLENPDIGQKMGEAGRNKFCNEFRLDHFEANFNKIIKNQLEYY